MLTDTAIKKAKPKDKPYKLSDAAGMYLEIMPNGSKYWRLKYRLNNVRRQNIWDKQSPKLRETFAS